jgi:hypothetical protein
MEEIKALFPLHQTHKKYILQELYHLLTASAPLKVLLLRTNGSKAGKAYWLSYSKSDRDQAIRSFIQRKKELCRIICM